MMSCHKTSVSAAALLTLFLTVGCVKETDPVDYVNPYAGNVSHMLVPTYPTVHLPNSMMRAYPVRASYTSEYLSGLPVIVTGHRGGSAMQLSVTTGDEEGPVVQMSYDREHTTPYSYDVTLEEGNIQARFGVSHQSAMYSLESPSPMKVILSSMRGEVKWEGGALHAVRYLGRGNGTKVYVFMEPDKAPSSVSTFSERGNSWVALGFDAPSVRLRYGVSYIDDAQAEANLHREIGDFDIDALVAEGRRIWNETLGRIAVKGDDNRKRVFYTSYYRTLERPVCISEDGRYWSGLDNAVHEDGGTPYYVDDWLWDTYRAAHPLRILMDSRIEEDILASYLKMGEYDGKGWVPNFPGVGGDSRGMNCNHGIASFADALAKGLDIDVKAAYEASRKTLREKTLVPWRGNPAGGLDEFYWEHGYFPALREGEKETEPTVDSWEKRQPVAVSLGTAYDCWCLSRLAEAAGAEEDAAFYRDWSLNYRKIFNPETGFFHPVDSEGEFIPDFDYDFAGGPGGREYYDENNGWVYRWDVQHNIPDLVGLMGGPEVFCAELDRMFAKPISQVRWDFYAKYPDHTGNVGQFSMANEPSLHIPYLYNYAGAPWKTQKRVRQMLDTWFRDDLMGIPGDEDGGGMTAFVVFSSLGFYPVTPGSDLYTIGSPVFEEARMKLSNGNVFTILAKNVSFDNKYIRSATLNGKPLDGPWLRHSQIMEGGTLVLEMSGTPEKEWGAVCPSDREEWDAAGWEWQDIGGGAQTAHSQFSFHGTTQSVSMARYPAAGMETSFVHAPAEQSSTTDTLAMRGGARIGLNGSYFNMRRLIPRTFFSIGGEVLGQTPSTAVRRSDGVLAVKDASGHELEIFPYDSTLTEHYRLDYRQCLASGPILIKDGRVPSFPDDSFFTMRHPRTFMGWNGDGMVYMVTVDGRFPGDADGMSIPELATLCRILGLKDAINLDGGGSSTLWTDRTGIINHPCDNKKYDHEGARVVPNAVLVR